MAITFELPAMIEEGLRHRFGNLDEAAKEAALIELYRQRKISHYELSQALGIDRFETEDVLKKHNVTEDLPSLEDLKQDQQNLRRLLGAAR
jgi:predicted HTH domain antitoxin